MVTNNKYEIGPIKYVILHEYSMKINRSSCSQMFLEIDVLKVFANFTGKHLCLRFFLVKWLQHRWFPVKFVEVSRKSFIQITWSGCFLIKHFLAFEANPIFLLSAIFLLFEFPKMARSHVVSEKEKEQLQNEYNCHNFYAFIRRLTAAFSSYLQK